MAITGVEYFSGGLFSSSTGTAARYFSDGFFIRDINIPGIVAVFVDGLLATAASDFTAVRTFTFGVFSGVVAGAGEGPELVWDFLLTARKRQDQFLPI